MKESFKTKQVFTTGEAAKICTVSQQTIIRCFDLGMINGYRVPGSKFRRIPRASLLAFMRENGIPTGPIESGRVMILLVDDDEQRMAVLRQAFAEDPRFDVHTACTVFDAGIQAKSKLPKVVIIHESVRGFLPQHFVGWTLPGKALEGVTLVVVKYTEPSELPGYGVLLWDFEDPSAPISALIAELAKQHYQEFTPG